MTHGTRSIGLSLAALALIIGSTGRAAEGASLSLNYTVAATGGGLYLYDFTLGVDTSSSPLTAGEGWSWIIFGASPTGPSLLSDFTLVGSIQGGPWSKIDSTSGFEYGPNLGPTFDGSDNPVYWQPTSSSDTIQWSGTSTADLGPGQLLFSILVTENGATSQSFAAMTDVSVVPEPSTLALGWAGLVACLGYALWRRWPAPAPI